MRSVGRGHKMLSDKALKDIGEAIEGLDYPSESDEPFNIVQPTGAIEGVAGTVEGFFDGLRDSEDWKRFESLKRVLETYLTNLKVVRNGKIRVDVYVVGQDPDGKWAGVHTVSV